MGESELSAGGGAWWCVQHQPHTAEAPRATPLAQAMEKEAAEAKVAMRKAVGELELTKAELARPPLLALLGFFLTPASSL